jgi:hypothetical protein
MLHSDEIGEGGRIPIVSCRFGLRGFNISKQNNYENNNNTPQVPSFRDVLIFLIRIQSKIIAFCPRPLPPFFLYFLFLTGLHSLEIKNTRYLLPMII